MNTALTRLLWKEYRAQRMLWIVLLLGWPGLHMIFMFNEVSVLDVAPVMMMMPVCFLVAAAALPRIMVVRQVLGVARLAVLVEGMIKADL